MPKVENDIKAPTEIQIKQIKLAHANDPVAGWYGPVRWIKRGVFYRCSFCGSIHPEELIKLLQKEGITIKFSDLKYGWPHKLYVKGAGEWIKFYTVHLLDMEDEQFAILTELIRNKSGFKFERNDDGLQWEKQTLFPWKSMPLIEVHSEWKQEDHTCFPAETSTEKDKTMAYGDGNTPRTSGSTSVGKLLAWLAGIFAVCVILYFLFFFWLGKSIFNFATGG